MFIIEVKDQQLRNLKSRFKRALQIALKLTATDLQSNIRQNAPKRSQLLSISFMKAPMGSLAWHVFSELKRSIWVSKGTGIYAGKGRIYPKNAKFLKFKIGGRVIFAKSIKGQKPNRYIENSIKTTESRLPFIINKAVRMTGG